MKEAAAVGMQMKWINEKIRQTADSAFSIYDLTGPQVGYLKYIQRAGGSISQRELEKRANVSHPTIVGVVNRLQNKEFVTIEIDEKDRRNRIIQLTDKAKEVSCQLQKQEIELNKQLMQGISNEEEQELHRLLNLMHDNLCKKDKRKERGFYDRYRKETPEI